MLDGITIKTLIILTFLIDTFLIVYLAARITALIMAVRRQMMADNAELARLILKPQPRE